jgi:hypothetical protein
MFPMMDSKYKEKIVQVLKIIRVNKKEILNYKIIKKLKE